MLGWQLSNGTAARIASKARSRTINKIIGVFLNKKKKKGGKRGVTTILPILQNLAVSKRQGNRFSNKEGAGSLGTLGKCDQQVFTP
jgi:hypothetical protein